MSTQASESKSTESNPGAIMPELRTLVDHAEEQGCVIESLELRRYLAEGEHRLNASEVGRLAKIAERAGLAAAAAWCRTEAMHVGRGPGFVDRVREMFEGKDETTQAEPRDRRGPNR